MAARRRKSDPLESSIEVALEPGRFVGYRGNYEFVLGLEEVVKDIEKLKDSGETSRAVGLYETFIGACYVKADEIDDSGGNFGTFVEELFSGWIKARQADGADPQETADTMIAWMKSDNYGFCYQMEKIAVGALNRKGMAAFEKVIKKMYLSGGSRKGRGKDKEIGRWRQVVILKAIYQSRRNAKAYLEMCEEEGIDPKACEVVANIHRKRGKPEEALEWVEKGLKMEEKGGYTYSSYNLDDMRRELLVELGRGGEALELAWEEFREHPSEYSYETLMEFVPRSERKEWHKKAMEESEKGKLESVIKLLVNTKETDRLVRRIASVSDEELEEMSYYDTEPAAKHIEKNHPAEAARVYKSLALRIVNRGKSKYYGYALSNLEKTKKCYKRAGMEKEWIRLIEEIRLNHKRKISFMPDFERLAEGKPKKREPTFLGRAKKHWPGRKKR